MKTIARDGLNLIDPKFTKYKAGMPKPFWEQNGDCFVFAAGYRVYTLPESEGAYLTTHDAKQGGIQLVPKTLSVLKTRVSRILGGKKEALEINIPTFGNLQFNLGTNGKLWANSMSAGSPEFRHELDCDLDEFLVMINDAIGKLEANGTPVPEPEIVPSTGIEPVHSLDGVKFI